MFYKKKQDEEIDESIQEYKSVSSVSACMYAVKHSNLGLSADSWCSD